MADPKHSWAQASARNAGWRLDRWTEDLLPTTVPVPNLYVAFPSHDGAGST